MIATIHRAVPLVWYVVASLALYLMLLQSWLSVVIFYVRVAPSAAHICVEVAWIALPLQMTNYYDRDRHTFQMALSDLH